jgi:putative ABC transport system substrate-binding protein
VGQTIAIDCVSAIGRFDQVPALARELVSRRPDVLSSGPSAFIKELKQETTTIPIVMLGSGDPVGYGLVTNLARPEANVTGVAFWGSDMLPKRIELLSEVVPQLRRLAIIGDFSDTTFIKIIEERAAVAAKRFGFSCQRFQAVLENDYDEIFARLAAEHFDAAYITSSSSNFQYGARIGKLALRHRIPAVGEASLWAKNGLLLCYGQDFNGSFARASEYIDKILRGAKPSELPVEQATKLLLTINLKTAKELGITIPPSVLARADEVIE